MEMDAVHGARRRFDAPAATLHDLASPLFPRTLRRHRGMDGGRVIGTVYGPPPPPTLPPPPPPGWGGGGGGGKSGRDAHGPRPARLTPATAPASSDIG